MRSASGSGFTVVLCTTPACGAGDEGTVAGKLIDALRGAVRTSRYGVLVTTGCLFGGAACGVRARAPMVLVQACDPGRRPTGPAVRIGPLRTGADVDALVTWLRTGHLDPAVLPARLLDLHRRAIAAPLN
ncbi:hypothetical protein ACQPZQ_32360 [Pseudonocardia sp. CA-142604]|uniref:hypothetical protein n=1 Tax=Pseudonocardia sp. CA-142604 TaxID=3240024 RepID=UPI003D8EAF54